MMGKTSKAILAASVTVVVLWASGVSGGLVSTTPKDGPQLDAFSRLRVSNPTPLISSQFQYNSAPLLWQSVLTGGGTATQVAATSSVNMTVATNGDKVVRQTFSYWRYQPGKSQQITITGVMGAIKTGIRQRIGYYDTANGLFFEEDGSNLRVVQRSSTSGSPVDTAINQSAWNLDKMNGTGPSGINLNMADAQIFVIDFQWLGVGRVRFGFDVRGVIVYCHEIDNANALPGVYMSTANLPLRYSIEMLSATTTTTMQQLCQAVSSEGGAGIETGYLFTANNGITPITVTTRRPILSIRPKATFGGLTTRGLIIPQEVVASIGSGNALIEVVYNGTLTGASFASADVNSMTEFDTAATAISGGTVLFSLYAASGANAIRGASAADFGSLLDKLVSLTLDASGANPTALTIVCTSFTSSVTATGIINWKEVY